MVSHAGQSNSGNPTADYAAIGVFLFGLPEIDTEMITQEITIRSGDKADIRTALEKMGISEKTLFSDLLGFFERNSATQPYNLSVDALDS